MHWANAYGGFDKGIDERYFPWVIVDMWGTWQDLLDLYRFYDEWSTTVVICTI